MLIKTAFIWSIVQQKLLHLGLADCVLALGFEKMERGSLSSKVQYSSQLFYNTSDEASNIICSWVCSTWTEPTLWTSTWRWWSTVMGWRQRQLHLRCSATLVENTWRSTVRCGWYSIMWILDWSRKLQSGSFCNRSCLSSPGTKPEHFAKIAWKNHKHSTNNPWVWATVYFYELILYLIPDNKRLPFSFFSSTFTVRYSQFRDGYSLEQVINSRKVFEFLTLLQCW